MDTHNNLKTVKRKAYGWRLLIALDQFFNVLLSPILNYFLPFNSLNYFGNEDETLSSVFGKNAGLCRWCFWLCRVLHLADKNHCKKSIEYDEQ